jgi:PAS domain-containing protein
MESMIPEGTAPRALLDAIPASIFITDSDLMFLDANRAGRTLLGPARELRSGQRGGELLHCLFQAHSQQGCGRTEFCSGCVVREVVTSVSPGSPAARRTAHMILGEEGSARDVWFQVSAAPFVHGDQDLIVLVMEDVTGIVESREP